MSRARLTLTGGDAKPDILDLLPDQPVTIGRSRDNSIVLRDEHASRLHARIYFEGERWMIRDFGLNGTRVNEERVAQAVELVHGYEIRVGEIRLRFTLEDMASPPKPWRGPSTTSDRRTVTEAIGSLTASSKFQSDELKTLCHFMAYAVEQNDSRDLIREAMRVLFIETTATRVAYLTLDANDPTVKLIFPDAVEPDTQLSRQLSRRVQRDGKMVWLATDMADTHHGDNPPFRSDALCLPLRDGVLSMGALHIHNENQLFTERAVRFAEALCGFLAQCLSALRQRRALMAENERLQSHITGINELVGDSAPLQELRALIERAAPQPYPVLITGEPGVGKELVALALHQNGPRASAPFVVIHCSRIAPSLMEAELFGYRKGAFSGADQDYAGLFSHADEGTLFLDEVGDLSLECQAKLLRVLDAKIFRPIGANAEIRTDLRILAATQRDLEADIRSGRFRQDLFYRLRVIQIAVPPLRDHAADIPYLVQYFLDKLTLETRRPLKITDAAMDKLIHHPWPGNLRQLRSVIESAVFMMSDESIDIDSLKIDPPAVPPTTPTLLDRPPSLDWEELERWAIEQALQQTGGNVSQAARILGMSRDTLHTRIRKKTPIPETPE